MNTGEDGQGLRKILDLSRMIAVFLLFMHFYIKFYKLFVGFGWQSGVSDRFLTHLSRIELFQSWTLIKLAALLFISISLLGVKGKKDEQIKFSRILMVSGVGLLLYFGSIVIFILPFQDFILGIVYMILVTLGFLMFIAAGTWMSRIIKDAPEKDIFNSENETFPQEERLLENEYSVNLPAVYRYKGKNRNSWINLINLFRGLLVAGTPGAGKSYFVIRHLIDQLMGKGFSMFLYDFKYDDLSVIAYNSLLKYADRFEVKPKFYVINFDDLNRTHRCNPLDPAAMSDITDATEASRTNYNMNQYHDPSYGFNLKEVLDKFNIKELDSPKEREKLENQLKNGDRPTITVEKNGEQVKLHVEAAPRYSQLNMFNPNGRPEKREQFLKETGQSKAISKGNTKEKGHAASQGLGV